MDEFVKEDLGAAQAKEKVLVPIDLQGEDKELKELLMTVGGIATQVIDKRWLEDKRSYRFGKWVSETHKALKDVGEEMEESTVYVAMKMIKFHCADWFKIKVKDDKTGEMVPVTYWKSKIPAREWRLVRDFKKGAVATAS